MKKFKLENNDFLKLNTFVVPNDYFEESIKKIMQHIENKTFTLDTAKSEIGFEVSDAYFENLTNQITAKAQKWKKLDEIEVCENYIVPERYFDLLPMQIQAKVTKKSKVFEFDFPAFVPKLAYSGIAAILVLGIYLGINYKNQNLCQDMLCNVSKSEIREYLNQHIEANHEALYENPKLENINIQPINNQDNIIDQIDVSQVEYEL